LTAFKNLAGEVRNPTKIFCMQYNICSKYVEYNAKIASRMLNNPCTMLTDQHNHATMLAHLKISCSQTWYTN